MSTIGSLIVRVGADIENWNSALDEAGRRLDSFANMTEKNLAKLNRVGSQLTQLGMGLSAAVTLPIVALGGAALKAAGDLEQNTIAFTTMLGSAGKAKAMLGELSDLAAKSPFELKDTIAGARRLLVMGVAAKDVKSTLRTLGDAVSAAGTGAEGLQRVTLALGQIQAKGKASLEEMNQLSEAGINAGAALAKALGVSVPEALKLVSKGVVSSSVLIKALLEDIEKKVGGASEAQNRTFNGQMSQLKDNITRTLQQIGAVLMPTAKSVVSHLQPILDLAVKMATAFAGLPAPLQSVAIGFLAIGAAIGPILFVSGTLIRDVGLIIGLLKTLGGAGGLAAGAAVSLTAMGIAAAAAAGAFAGWGLGTWVNQNMIPLKETLGQIISFMTGLKIPSLVDAKWLAAADTEEMESSVRRLAEGYKKFGVTVERGAMTTTQYAAALSEAAQAAAASEKIQADLKKTIDGVLGSHTALAKKHKEFSMHALQTALALDAYNAAVEHAAVSQDLFSDAMQRGAFEAPQLEGAIVGIGAAVDLMAMKMEAAYKSLNLTSTESLRKTAQAAEEAFNTILAFGTETWEGITLAAIAAEEAQIALAQRLGENVEARLITLKELKDQITGVGHAANTTTASVGSTTSKVAQQISTVVTDLSRGMAQAILQAKSLGDVFKRVAESIAEAILRTIIENGMKKLIKVIGDALAGLKGIWGWLGKIMGGGAQGGGPAVAGSAGGGASTGGIGGAVAGAGITGLVGAVSGVVGAVSGIIGNFQMKGMNKTLDLIETNTRYTQIALLGPLGVIELLWKLQNLLVDINKKMTSSGGKLAGFADGTAFVPSTGIAMIHAGERIIDADSNREITAALSRGLGKGSSNTQFSVTFNGVTNARDLMRMLTNEVKRAGGMGFSPASS